MPSALVLLSVPGLGALLEPPAGWADAIRQGVEHATATPTKNSTDSEAASTSTERVLVVFVSAPLFSAPFANLSFDRLAKFLQWSYAQAWSAAVARDHLLLDVDVVLVPGPERVAEVLRHESAQIGGRDGDATLVLGDDALLKAVDLSSLQHAQTHALDLSSSSTASDASAPALPQYPVVALGGTFDHLHPGHKILLGTACALTTRTLIVGITSDEMLRAKAEAHLLESLERRKARVAGFIELFTLALRGASVEADVVTLRDVAGPAGTTADLQALVLTEETLAGGDTIAEIRRSNGLGALEQHVIGVLGAKGETDLGQRAGGSAGGDGGQAPDAKALAAAKVGSTAIRKWLAARQKDGLA